MVRTLNDKGLDESDRRMLRDIKKCGWHFIVIPDEDGTPGWVFTVGLFHSYGMPEVAIFGLGPDVSASILESVAHWASAGTKISPRKSYDELIEGYPCAFRTIKKKWYEPFFGSALWFYQGNDFPMLQCFWPDKQSRFPWDAKFAKGARHLQPMLHRSSAKEARAEALLRTME